ncbi:hypothetical protein [Rubrivirga sp. IMCC43871]|uniref:hypothetical protein n=1 Tax=Rubrivirga sp. IMCC43871 TaxID=3391575 RepID=UPI00398FDEA5
MILRRITQHVRDQNWTAIAIDFVIVVVGVFVGLQVSNWNAARADARLGRVYTERLLVDLHQNRESRLVLVAYYDAVAASAERTVALLAAPGDDRALVIHAYRATEWSGFRDVRATWDEILFSGNVGLLPPTALASGLGVYFSYSDLSSANLDRLKDTPYRQTVRGTIPHVLQRSIREHCSDVTDDIQVTVGFRSDCDFVVDDALVAETARALRSDATLVEDLRNQFSELGIGQGNLLGDIVLLDRVIAALEGRDPEDTLDDRTP